MNTTGSVKYACALIALAVCSACSGSAVAPSTAGLSGTYVGKILFVNGRPTTAARLSPMPRYATLVPDKHGNSKDFEYIFNDYESYASIFNYPKSDQQVGSIYGDGGQGCTNVLYGYGNKIFWNIGGDTQITEYKVPKKPIKTYSDSAGAPSSCAMDTSGDLAVGILSGTGGGDVDVFKAGSNSGTLMSTPLSAEYFDGYDNNGNLFADGFTKGRKFALVELPKTSRSFETITTSNTIEFPGSVQWDGTYLTVLDQETNSIYQYTVVGKTATLEGTVSLTGVGDCAQTWIATGVVFCADNGNGGSVFNYPAGGSAIALFTGNFDFPLGVTAAKK